MLGHMKELHILDAGIYMTLFQSLFLIKDDKDFSTKAIELFKRESDAGRLADVVCANLIRKLKSLKDFNCMKN